MAIFAFPGCASPPNVIAGSFCGCWDVCGQFFDGGTDIQPDGRLRPPHAWVSAGRNSELRAQWEHARRRRAALLRGGDFSRVPFPAARIAIPLSLFGILRLFSPPFTL
jgi:hypothetical protein